MAHYHPKGHRINVYTDKNAIEAYDGRTTPTMPLSCRMSNKRRSSGYKREFYSENDLIMVDGKGLKTTDPNKAKTVRIRGRTVPKPYNSPGSKDFTFTRYSRQGSRGGKRNLVDPVISGVPRSMKNPMVCFDKMGPDIAKLAGFTTVSGNDVLKEISSGKTVFYFARPTGKTQQPKTKQNSIFSRNPTATAI